MRKSGFRGLVVGLAVAGAMVGAGGCAGECDDCPGEKAAAAAPGAAAGAAAAAVVVPAGLKRATFTVEGMTCEGCASGIMAALRGVEGVSNAGVEYASKEAWAVVKPEVPETALVAAIEKHGYKVTVKSVTGG